MILYMDSSALVKKYVMESGTDDVLALWKTAASIAISTAGYAESLAAIHRKKRESVIGDAIFGAIVGRFQKDYESMIRIQVNDELNGEISRVVSKHPLRGFDAIHLASALIIQEHLSERLLFACFDKKLNHAAEIEGLSVFPDSI